jgi:pyruvate, water dikinase
MKGFCKLVTSWVPGKKQIRRISVSEKFAYFRAIGAANDSFLRQLAGLQERLNTSIFSGMNPLAAETEALRGYVRSMVESFVAMTGEQFKSLIEQHESIDRQIARQLQKAHPAGSGPLIVWPTDAEALRPEIVGPKAARLAEVALNTGLQVPPFFSISVYSYRLFMEASGIGDVIRRMLGSHDFRQSLSIKSFCDMVGRAFAEASLPQVLEEQLLAGYRKLVDLSPHISGVAVRSSAVVEDAESSFAGQFESILNVGESDLINAYKEVVASKYRREAVKYAIARGYGDEEIDMAVLVMTMVQPSASGVAFSQCPDRPDKAMVTAVPGLAQAADSGKVIPDTYFVPIEAPAQVEVLPGKWNSSLHCAAGGGLVEFNEEALSPRAPALQEEAARRVASAANALERHFGSPQDVEWALDKAGTLIMIQTRPLYISSSKMTSQASTPAVEGYRILERGIRAAGGAALGKVHHLLDLEAIETVPEGSILCVPTTSPKLAGVMGTVRGIIAAAGSPTGHMATVAREFEIPCLVGAENAFANLPEGTLVTVDGNAGIIYEGEVKELLSNARAAAVAGLKNPMYASLQQLLAEVAPLNLTEPDAPTFSPDNCRTLHDVARFVHQKSIMEMFKLEDLSPREQRAAHRLIWRAPMEVLLLDLGGGIAEGADRRVPVEQIRSAALLALIEGMTDPRLRWAGPVGFDLKGFMSVVVRSAADDQRYGEPIYCVCAQDYVHFASRLAYHFATVDAICGQSVNENYARFLFFGGAAVAARREWRAHLLATVLRFNGFVVKQEGDRVEAMLAKRHAEQTEEALVMLGRLMMASRHLDMVIESQADAQALAQAFLSGDYAFEHIRRTGIQS